MKPDMGSGTSKALFPHCHMAGTQVVPSSVLSLSEAQSPQYTAYLQLKFTASPNDDFKNLKLRYNIYTVVAASLHALVFPSHIESGWSVT